MMHQVSLCIGDDCIRRDFVAEFRDRFAKQVCIASHVIGPLLRTNKLSTSDEQLESMNTIVKCFGRFGYIPACIQVPMVLLDAVESGCQGVVPMYIPLGTSYSTHAELIGCMAWIEKTCVGLSRKAAV